MNIVGVKPINCVRQELHIREDAKEYFCNNNYPDIKKGSEVLCVTGNGLMLAKVENIYPFTAYETHMHVLSPIVMDGYLNGKKKIEEMQNLVEVLDQCSASMQKMYVYEMLAKDNKEVAGMLKRLKELQDE